MITLIRLIFSGTELQVSYDSKKSILELQEFEGFFWTKINFLAKSWLPNLSLLTKIKKIFEFCAVLNSPPRAFVSECPSQHVSSDTEKYDGQTVPRLV